MAFCSFRGTIPAPTITFMIPSAVNEFAVIPPLEKNFKASSHTPPLPHSESSTQGLKKFSQVFPEQVIACIITHDELLDHIFMYLLK